MSKTYPSLSLLLTLALFSSEVFADTVTLKTGEHLEGKVTQQNDKTLTMEVQVAAGISDERVIPMTQVERVDKVPPEVLAYQRIAAIQLGKDSMAVSQYDPYITALESFVTQFPSASQAEEVQGTIKAFQDEKKRVEKGEVKIDREWLSKAQVEKEKVQIGAQLAYNYMASQSAGGDYTGALNTFLSMEKAFPGAAALPEAIDLAQKDMVQLKGMVDRAIPNQKAFAAEQKKNLAEATPKDKATMELGMKQEQAQQEALLKATPSGKWPPFMANSEKGLAEMTAMLTKEGPRLTAMPVAKMEQSLRLSVEGKQSMVAGDLDTALDKLKEATTLWAVNEMAVRLTKEAQGLKTAEASAAAEAAKAATPVPKKTTPAPTPKKHANTPLPAPGSASATEALPPVAQGPVEKRPFLTTVSGAATAVVGTAAVLAGANVFVKMRKRKAEEAENA